jgi:hypothetical protein
MSDQAQPAPDSTITRIRGLEQLVERQRRERETLRHALRLMLESAGGKCGCSVCDTARAALAALTKEEGGVDRG